MHLCGLAHAFVSIFIEETLTRLALLVMMSEMQESEFKHAAPLRHQGSGLAPLVLQLIVSLKESHMARPISTASEQPYPLSCHLADTAGCGQRNG